MPHAVAFGSDHLSVAGVDLLVCGFFSFRLGFCRFIGLWILQFPAFQVQREGGIIGTRKNSAAALFVVVGKDKQILSLETAT